MKRIKFFASILLMLCLSIVCCAQTKIDWKQIKNIPDTLEFKNVLLEHLLFKSAYQPVMESIHMGGIYYDNMTERMRIYENGQWRDLSVSIASDSIGAPLTILGYLQASDIYASQSAYIGKDVNVKGNVNASGTSTFNYLKVNNALKVPTVASAALGVGSVYYDTSANKLKVLNSSNQWKVVSVDVDSALSTTSTNPVENKAITAKINQTDADLINGMATTLQASYNYANGIATQAYNYADSTASASKNYADLQISILNNTISEKLASGTSDLYVKSIITTNASITNRLDVRSLDIGLAFTVPSYYDPALLPTSDPRKASIYYNSANKYLGFAYLNPSNAVATKIIATEDNTVSNVATGTNNTIAVTKNGVTTNIAVGGEGKNPSSSTPPSNPTVGQIYFDTSDNMLKYWNGTTWISVGVAGGAKYVVQSGSSDGTGANLRKWYRLWSDGWLEQGGIADSGSVNAGTVIGISFDKSFADTNYTMVATAMRGDPGSQSSAYAGTSVTYQAVNEAGVIFGRWDTSSGCRYVSWYACGQAASN